MNCAVNGCEGKALIGYGGKWVCGDCIMKVIKKRQEKELDELEDL